MILKERIPESFYKLFRTKNRDAYMSCLMAIYEENNRMYYSFGMTEAETRAVIDETIGRLHILWQIDEQERLEEMEDDDLDQERENLPDMIIPSSRILKRFLRWGWLSTNYDEKLNENMISFPEYSQLYIELFERLEREDHDQERQSIMSVYSSLFTYCQDQEKDTRILEGALLTSRDLSQMLSNIQDGMREYFEELSLQTDFLGIQEVLVKEINNSDSRKYAILTTQDSFYRYKESVRELISKIVRENEIRRENLERSAQEKDKEREYAVCQRTDQLIYRIEREFDGIEKKYNNLIRQKTVFAKRALARIHYIMQEGAAGSDSVERFLKLWSSQKTQDQNELLEALRDGIQLSAPIKSFGADSFYKPREEKETVFVPVRKKEESRQDARLEDFVPKPLYTHGELEAFRQKNMQDGIFTVNEDSVNSVQDLEKLMFLWQEASDNRRSEDKIVLGEDITGGDGFTFSRLSIKEGK